MDREGQLHLEAIICIALLFALIAIAVGVVNSLKDTTEENNEMLLAEAKAQKCSVAADVLFSNSGGKIEVKENCYAGEEHEVKSVFNGYEKKAFSIAEEVSSTQVGGRTVLEVKVDEHYR